MNLIILLVLKHLSLLYTDPSLNNGLIVILLQMVKNSVAEITFWYDILSFIYFVL